MEWIQTLNKCINYIEDNLLQGFTLDDIAANAKISTFYLQKGFKIMTGYSVSEYIRNRRLYFAALDVIKGKDKIIEISYLYGYDTPESFSKAFKRFHGVSPMQLKKQPAYTHHATF